MRTSRSPSSPGTLVGVLVDDAVGEVVHLRGELVDLRSAAASVAPPAVIAGVVERGVSPNVPRSAYAVMRFIPFTLYVVVQTAMIPLGNVSS